MRGVETSEVRFQATMGNVLKQNKNIVFVFAALVSPRCVHAIKRLPLFLLGKEKLFFVKERERKKGKSRGQEKSNNNRAGVR